MTTQITDELINECPDVNLDGFYLYDIITGDIHSKSGWGVPYPFKHQPRQTESAGCSANRRGYVSSFQLTKDGQLKLVSYRYDAFAVKVRDTVTALPIVPSQKTTSDPEIEYVEEQLVGDFWMVMKNVFFVPRTYIPFRAGVIVKDREQWFKENNQWPVSLEVTQYTIDPRLAILTFHGGCTSSLAGQVLMKIVKQSLKLWSEQTQPFPPDMTGVVFTTNPPNRFEILSELHEGALVNLIKFSMERRAPLALLGLTKNSVLILRFVGLFLFLLPVDSLAVAAGLCARLSEAKARQEKNAFVQIWERHFIDYLERHGYPPLDKKEVSILKNFPLKLFTS